MKEEEIAILVLSTRNPAYAPFRQAISGGWMRKMLDRNIKCYFYSGDHGESGIEGDEIRVKAPDRLGQTSRKLLAALDLLLNRHPDTKLVYRTNLSSYVETGNFLRFIGEKGLDDSSYTGVVGKTTHIREYFYGNRYLHKLFTIVPVGEPIKFASGSGLFIGRKRVEKLLEAPPVHTRLIDDVMIAKTLEAEPDEDVAPPRFDIMDRDEHRVEPSTYERLVGEEMLFHYRFKTSDRGWDAEMLKAFDDPDFRYASCTLR